MNEPSKNLSKLFFILFVLLELTCRSQEKNEIDSLLTLIRSEKKDSLKVRPLFMLSEIYKGNKPDTSIILSTQALHICENLKWEKGIANAQMNIGSFYYLKGDYSRAFPILFKALELYKKTDVKRGIYSAMGNISVVYQAQSNYPKALEYYFQAMKISEEAGDKQATAKFLGNIGVIFDEQGDKEKALEYYLKSMRILEELG